MWHKHHISLPTALITSIITLLVSGSDEFLFTSLEERLQRITTNALDLIEEDQALFIGNCEKQYTVPLCDNVFTSRALPKGHAMERDTASIVLPFVTICLLPPPPFSNATYCTVQRPQRQMKLYSAHFLQSHELHLITAGENDIITLKQ